MRGERAVRRPAQPRPVRLISPVSRVDQAEPDELRPRPGRAGLERRTGELPDKRPPQDVRLTTRGESDDDRRAHPAWHEP